MDELPDSAPEAFGMAAGQGKRRNMEWNRIGVLVIR